jgi:putative hydrolase of the HAD superfamily
MILVFDLDDTLYPEITYVKSGLKEVSLFLNKNFGIDDISAYSEMYSFLQTHGRGKVFNNILKINQIYTKKNLNKCISVYRKHNPEINLYKDAEKCIKRFKNFKKYIVTDGNIIAQRKKIKSLDLHDSFEKIIPTYQYGLSYSKPSVNCFQMILKYENSKPENMIYIGDNPHKDFINVKKIGIKTIRILRGSFKDIYLDNEHEADYSFKNLHGITQKMIGNIYENR